MSREIEQAVVLMAAGEAALEAGDYAAAREHYGQALALRRHALGEFDGDVATSLNNLGVVSRELGDYAAAQRHHEEALAIQQKVFQAPHPDLAKTLNNLGAVLLEKGDLAAARDLFERSLTMRRQALGETHPDIAKSFNNLGIVVARMGDYAAARGFLEQALAAREKNLGPSHPDVAEGLNNLGNLSELMGDYLAARNHHERALAIRLPLLGEDHPDVAMSLGNIGLAAYNLGDYAAAADYYERALTIWRQRLDDKHYFVGQTLHNLGNIMSSVGDDVAARDYYEQALATKLEALGDRHPTVASTLDCLGILLRDLGDNAAARARYEESLAIKRQTLGETHPDIAISLHNLGSLFAATGDKAEARSHLEQALAIWQKSLGETHLYICESFLSLGQLSRAEEAFDRASVCLEQALRIALVPDNVVHLPSAYHELSLLKTAEGSPDAAVFFGKQAVNALQRQRAKLTALPTERQRSFLKTKEKTYRDLADLLVETGRLGEAQQVLAMLKEEELFDLLRRDAGQDPRLTLAQLTALEAEWQRHGDALGQDLARLTSQVASLRKIEARTAEQEAELQQARAALDAAGREFRIWLDGLRGTLVSRGSADSAESRHSAELNLRLLERLQGELRALGPDVALLSYVLGENRLSIILTTASFQVSREAEIAEPMVNRLVHEFRLAIDQQLDGDLSRTRQALWRHLIEPVMPQLEEIGAKTLMIVPYGTLRYLPFAALHDGTRYLVERFAVSILTLAAHGNLRDRGTADWKVAGLGVSREVPGYRQLRSVNEELLGIVRATPEGGGVYPGTIRLDEAFTEPSFADALEGHEAVHVASHFVLNPAQGLSSHLLLGDGTTLSLDRLRDVSFDFHRLELMTLSACETAMGGGGENGREFEGFAALVQQRGVKAVIASLWPVADESTAPLMTAFYRACQAGGSKAAALQAAQLALLHGRYPHPYHWAPFMLMGNWR